MRSLYNICATRFYYVRSISILILFQFLSACQFNFVKEISFSEINNNKNDAIIIFEIDNQDRRREVIEFAKLDDDQCFIWNRIQIDSSKKINIFRVPEGQYKSLSLFKLGESQTSISFNIRKNMKKHFGTILLLKDSTLSISKEKSKNLNDYEFIKISPSNLYSRKICTP